MEVQAILQRVSRRGVRPQSPRNRFDRLRLLRQVLRPIETAQIRWFGFSLVSLVFRTPVLLLHTSGRRSGRRRSTPLAYYRLDDQTVAMVGGANGQARLPDWVANVRAEPEVSITIDRVAGRARVEELIGAERAAMWTVLRRRWPRIDVYQSRAGRDVPVFVLHGETASRRGR